MQFEIEIRETTAHAVPGAVYDKASLNGLPCETYLLGATRGGHLYQFCFYTACLGGLWRVDAKLNDMEKLVVLTIEELQRVPGAYYRMLEASEEIRTDMVLEYMVRALDKFEGFTNLYKTDSEFKVDFQKTILGMVEGAK